MTLTHRLRRAFTNIGAVTFCESCSQVCDTACRANARRDHQAQQVHHLAGRPF